MRVTIQMPCGETEYVFYPHEGTWYDHLEEFSDTERQLTATFLRAIANFLEEDQSIITSLMSHAP